MGRMLERAKRFDGEKTVRINLEDWLAIHSSKPEPGNTIVTDTHEGTITDVRQVNQHAVDITFHAYKRVEPKPKRVHPLKEYRPQARRIAMADTLDVTNAHYRTTPKGTLTDAEIEGWEADYKDQQAAALELRLSL